MSGTIFAVTVIIGLVIVLLMVGVICLAIDYYDEKQICAPKIEYKQFKVMYAINPNNWYIKGFFPEYKNTKIDLGFWGILKFIFFQLKENRKAFALEKDQKTVKLISAFQKDIDDYKSKNEKYLKSELEKITNEKEHIGSVRGRSADVEAREDGRRRGPDVAGSR